MAIFKNIKKKFLKRLGVVEVIKYKQKMIFYKNPMVDINGKKVNVRDELAIKLVQDGIITITQDEQFIEDLQKTEITLVAEISVVK